MKKDGNLKIIFYLFGQRFQTCNVIFIVAKSIILNEVDTSDSNDNVWKIITCWVVQAMLSLLGCPQRSATIDGPTIIDYYYNYLIIEFSFSWEIRDCRINLISFIIQDVDAAETKTKKKRKRSAAAGIWLLLFIFSLSLSLQSDFSLASHRGVFCSDDLQSWTHLMLTRVCLHVFLHNSVFRTHCVQSVKTFQVLSIVAGAEHGYTPTLVIQGWMSFFRNIFRVKWIKSKMDNYNYSYIELKLCNMHRYE